VILPVVLMPVDGLHSARSEAGARATRAHPHAPHPAISAPTTMPRNVHYGLRWPVSRAGPHRETSEAPDRQVRGHRLSTYPQVNEGPDTNDLTENQTTTALLHHNRSNPHRRHDPHQPRAARTQGSEGNRRCDSRFSSHAHVPQANREVAPVADAG
jgi:hypothetical protein